VDRLTAMEASRSIARLDSRLGVRLFVLCGVRRCGRRPWLGPAHATSLSIVLMIQCWLRSLFFGLP
jgi:hypothetical protein